MKQQFAMFFALITIATICTASNGAATSASDSAKNEAAARYSEDRKICADESNASRRMQCLRDAKHEYSSALKAAKSTSVTKIEAGKNAKLCNVCGQVTAVKVMEKEGESGAAGLIAGGVAGALLGHQIGAGTGKDVATLAGAAGGAYAGKRIEGKMKATKTWVVSVKFENGSERTFNFEKDPSLVTGTLVKLSGSSIVRR